ncbi:hypothetical protein D3C76_1509090 [compost metagenome]
MHITMSIVGDIAILSKMLIEHEFHVELTHGGHHIIKASPDLLVKFYGCSGIVYGIDIDIADTHRNSFVYIGERLLLAAPIHAIQDVT